MTELFGKQRLSDQDVIYFMNGDVLRGEATNREVTLLTPYAKVSLPLRKCAGLSFEGSETLGEKVVAINGDAFSGIVEDRLFTFRIGGSGAEVPIRKERIRFLLLRRSGIESSAASSQAGSRTFLMANGDRFTGRLSVVGLSVLTDLGEVSTPLSEVESFEVERESGGKVRLRKSSGETVSGVLQTDEFALSLDLGARLEGVFKDRFLRVEGISASLRVEQLPPVTESVEPSGVLAELPEEAEEPPSTPEPTASPTASPRPLPTETPLPPVSRLYENPEYGFRMDRPSAKWKVILSKEELAALNPDAVVGYESEDGIYSTVIVESLPGVELRDYADAVRPGLEDLKPVSDQPGTLSGLPALKREWQAVNNGIPVRFFQTLLEKGDYRVQIVTYTAEANLDDEKLHEIRALEDSFRPIPTDIPTPETPAPVPPRGVSPGLFPPR